jgi:hypothetical protein
LKEAPTVPRTIYGDRAALLGLVCVAGVSISAVDNFLFGGEVTPILPVLLLLFGAIGVGCLRGTGKWFAIVLLWVWLPMAHVLKHMFDVRDTLQPNTYDSIAILAAFTLAVALSGLVIGIGLRRVLFANAE